ncbi:MAG: GlxA family transcriptional regulator [Solirubrobacteraceae bacterium]
MTRHVVALALPGVVLLDLAGPVHVFDHCGAPEYSFELAGVRAGPVRTSSGFDITTRTGLAELRNAHTIVVPGTSPVMPPPDEALAALQDASRRGARLLSVCTGAFALAHAGLLDGRRATTHWEDADRLAAAFPAVTVDPAVLYVDEGTVLTSAGVAAGIDLCLHVVRRDLGAERAADIARRMVVPPHRDGGQAQFLQRPIERVPEERGPRAAGLQATRAWALERLAEPLTVERMAREAAVSPRTFARRFVEETGTTPAQWLIDQRVRTAQELLEHTDLPVEGVAARSGFGTSAGLREHLRRRLKTTPTAYRRTFRTRSS